MTTASDNPTYPWEKTYPRDLNWRAGIPTGPLYEIFDNAVSRFAARPMIDFLDKTFSYGEIGRMVDRAAKGLQQIGVGKGDRVGLCLPNTPYSVIFYFAALKIGGTVVNFNPLYAEREIEKQAADAGVKVMVTLDLKATYDKVAAIVDKTPVERVVVCRLQDVLPFPKNLLFPIAKKSEIAKIDRGERTVFFKSLLRNDGRFTPVEITPEKDVAVLQYTGGTTGLPKGAMLTHANLTANTHQAGMWFVDAKPGDERIMAVLPFFHVFAMTSVMNFAILIGAEMIMYPRFEIDQVLDGITRKKPTLFPGVPTMYTAIINYKDLAKYDLSSIHSCISGGAPLPVEVKSRFEELTGCTLVEGYGLTESSPVTHCNPFHGENKAGSIGLPLPGTMVEIVSLDDPSKVLPQGEKGEICIRGPQVMAGYWNRPDETAAALRNGRLHTGDVGYIDEDGYTFIVDRLKDLIIASGYNVYPRVVEEAIYLHDAVAEVTVIGVPDEYRGQTVKAFVKLAEGKSLTEDELKSFLEDKLSPIEQPKEIEFRDELPKTLIGKLSKKELVAEETAKRDAAQAGEQAQTG